MEKRKELKKLNNGGFSLVELIIVIAIMAILVGVLAPQYMKYVGRSRIASDQQNATAIVSAIQVYASDPQAEKQFDGTEKIELSPSTGGAVTGEAMTAALENAAIDVSKIKLQSNTWGATVTISVSVDKDGNIEVKSSNEAILQPQGNSDDKKEGQ